MSDPFDSNNSHAMFATILERVDEIKRNQTAHREEARERHEYFHTRLKEHDEEITRLKTEDIVRSRQTKWAVALVGGLSWAVTTFINWPH